MIEKERATLDRVIDMANGTADMLFHHNLYYKNGENPNAVPFAPELTVCWFEFLEVTRKLKQISQMVV